MAKYEEELQIALEAARAGARIVSENYGKFQVSNTKENAKGLVTQTDLEAEKAIIQILQSKSKYNILSEESGSLGKSTGPIWVVDPLDGTNNFARSLPLFAVSVGLMDEDESLLGVIIDPVQNKEFYALKNKGAYCDGKRLQLSYFNTEYIPSIFLNHGYDEADRNKFKKLSQIFASSYNILKLGTTALELCYVANGSVDAFICSGDAIWDFAAGIVIAQESGYIFTDWQGNKWERGNDHLLIARPEIHKEIIDLIKG